MMLSLTTFSKTLCRAYFCEKTEYATDEVTSSNCNIIFSINEESRLLEFMVTIILLLDMVNIIQLI